MTSQTKPLAADTKKSTLKPKVNGATTWGRYNSSSDSKMALNAAFMLLLTPLTVLFTWNVLYIHKGEIFATLKAILSNWSIVLPGAANDLNPLTFVQDWAFVVKLYLSWVAFQAIIYVIVPGRIAHGQITPGGHLLPYCVNGWNAYWISIALFCIGSFPIFGLELFSPTIIYDNWAGLLVVTNIFAYALTLFAYIKASLWPSHPEDVKWSGSILYDIFMGVELNPRFGSMWDFKLFFNGRPGIIAWTLINISMAAAQFEKYQSVSTGMILVNIFQFVYVADFFYHENWYLRTIDIAHDHFGFYFAWGDTVWLPMMYTIQAQFLVQCPDTLTNIEASLVFALFSLGYWIFRTANNQKDYFRSKKGDCKIWGSQAQYISAPYHASDGSKHEGLLLCSGFWGLSRHFNYLGDLLLSLAMCLACGTVSHLMPFFYIIYMTLILVQRVSRDNQRCQEKYGSKWNEYCTRVPYKIIPYVY
jgi:7-dehydrocholesterol reductase